LAWHRAQDVSVAFIDYNPLHNALPNNNEYIVYIMHNTSQTVIPYPYSQAKELFPAILTWHQMWTSGRNVAHPLYGNPKLAWTVDFWDRMIAPLDPNLLNLNNDQNILSKLRNVVTNKKTKLSHATTEIIVEVRYGDKLDKSRNLKALIDTGSSGCIILNEFTIGIHHKRSENPQQWMTKGGLFQTNGICPVKFYLPEFSTQECIKWNFHVDNSKHITKSRYDVILGRDLLEQLPLARYQILRQNTIVARSHYPYENCGSIR
jgi:hypothetical protein